VTAARARGPARDDRRSRHHAAATRREGRKAAQAESARVDAQKAWLEAILQSLSEGVFVCNRQHRIMLYNRAAVALVDAPDRIGLGRSLGDVLSIAPLRHSLTRLENRMAPTGTRRSCPRPSSAPRSTATGCSTAAWRSCATGRARVRLPGDAVDISGELALLAKGDGVRRALTRDLRGMVGNLRAAAETMTSLSRHAPEDRGGLREDRARRERAITRDARRLGQRDPRPHARALADGRHLRHRPRQVPRAEPRGSGSR
jgi:DNA polymerase III subunit epsilon